MSKEILIPELRFPDFKNKEEWDKDNLGNIAANITTGKLDANAMVENGKYRFYTCAKNYYRINEYAFDTEAILIAGNGAYLGYIHHYKGKFNAYQRTYVLSDFSKDVLYLKYYLERFLPSRIKSEKKEGNTPYIVLGTIKDMKVLFPESPVEQQKIGSCLSSLDDIITAQQAKLDLLKSHKKGLMQNLFPQAGEKVPRYRFPEFAQGGEWKFEPFNKVYSFLVTNSLSREFLNYERGTVRNIHYGDIHTKFSTLFDITRENVPFINPEVSIEKIKSENYCIEGDMIFADASEDILDVGKSIEIVNLNGQKLLAGLHTLMARQLDKKIQLGFGGYLFQSNPVRKQIQREAQGAKVLGISGTRIGAIEISYPQNPKEQQKILECLTTLDSLLSGQYQIIEKLKMHKKGLMQGLFTGIQD
jgi:type I restriction enzyme, S subunit